MSDPDIFELVGGRLWSRPGWSQCRVARELGISNKTVQHWHGGRRKPSAKMAERYAALIARIDAADAPAR